MSRDPDAPLPAWWRPLLWIWGFVGRFVIFTCVWFTGHAALGDEISLLRAAVTGLVFAVFLGVRDLCAEGGALHDRFRAWWDRAGPQG